MKILIVEDSLGLAERVKLTLSKQYIVDVVTTGNEGIAQSQAVSYEVIILDLGLPDIHGSVVCRTIRDNGVKTPILILTGVSDVQSRVDLLNIGADDYLIKPFYASELLARVDALARRQARAFSNTLIKMGDLEIDVDKRQVTRAGVVINLRRKEFDILRYLVSNSGRAVSREMIIDHAWENTKDRWNNSVDVHIKRLRDKIDRPFKSSIIKTAYGIGYMVDGAQR